MRRIPAAAGSQFGVFTTQQAIAAGWSQDALDRAVNYGRLQRLCRGAFVVADPPTDLPPGPAQTRAPAEHEIRRSALLQRAAAGALLVPGSCISHSAAAVARGLPLLTVPSRACLAAPPGARSRNPLFHLHQQVEGARGQRGNLRVVGIAQTCLDIACEHGVSEGVVVADAALQARLVTMAQLRDRASRTPGPIAKELCRLADGRSESPLESISRLAMIGFEVPPELQVCVYGPGRRFVGRVDFLWSELGVVGEADGSAKYAAPGRYQSEPLRAEKWRQDQLTKHRLVVVRWGWREARNPAVLQQLIRDGFEQARMLRAAGVMPRVEYLTGAPPSR